MSVVMVLNLHLSSLTEFHLVVFFYTKHYFCVLTFLLNLYSKNIFFVWITHRIFYFSCFVESHFETMGLKIDAVISDMGGQNQAKVKNSCTHPYSYDTSRVIFSSGSTTCFQKFERYFDQWLSNYYS
jgi:hypothetical protein